MRPGYLPVFVLLIVSVSTGLTRAEETPVRGGTLVVALAADPGHLNPAITTSGATHAAAELLYNGLLGRDEHGEPRPELAESWQVEQAGSFPGSRHHPCHPRPQPAWRCP